jgi:hypothetical protein
MRNLLASCMVIMFVVAPIGSAADDSSNRCVVFGTLGQPVCKVSLYELFVFPERYDGKLVQVSGFLADGPATLLFIDQGAWSTSRTVDSLVLRMKSKSAEENLDQLNRSNVMLLGRFHSKDRYLKEASSEPISGSIDVEELSRPIAPWGYAEPIPSPHKSEDSSDGERPSK